MKIYLKRAFIACFIMLLAMPHIIAVFADVPYNTWTVGPNGKWIGTQTAYEPLDMLSYDLADPEDLFADDSTGSIYIADTGNSRILMVSKDEVRSIGEGILKSPSGIYVNLEGHIYTADYGHKKVFVFDSQGRLLKQIEKPDEPIYGKTSDFVPKKLAADKRNNIYVISEGSVNGIVQLNNEGGFTGFIGSNKSDVSLKMIIQRMIYSNKQKAQFFKVAPPSPTSIAIDTQGLIYTVTGGIKSEAVKKLNITGMNILPADMYKGSDKLDIDVDKDGNIYTLDKNGYIDVYDSFGNLLFSFGGKDVQHERTGMFKNPVAIDVTDKGELYVVDKERRIICSYKTTEFADKVLEGVKLYKQGLYIQSQEIWRDILKMNSYFILSYKALANADFKQGNYAAALAGFRLAEDRTGYSEAFWQIRNYWLQDNITKIVLILLGFMLLRFILKKANKRYGIFVSLTAIRKSLAKLKLISHLMYAFKLFKHPIDAFYDIKHSGKASVLSATILYMWFLIMHILGIFITGFVFSQANPAYINLSAVVFTTLVPLALFIISNYLVSTINDGEGSFKNIYTCTIYSLTPYLVICTPIQLLSNVLTLNEAFLFDFPLIIARGWSLLLLFIMLKEIHDYSFKETVRNILLTLFGMVLIVLVLFILFILFNQELDFIKSIIQELRIRV